MNRIHVIGCCAGRTRPGKVGDTDIVGILTVGLLAVGGYFAYKFISGAGNGNTSNATGVQQTSAATASNDLTKSQSTFTQSVPDSSLNGIANQIFQLVGNDGSTPVSDDTAYSVEQLLFNLNNSTDWFRLVQLFGTKQMNTGGWLSMCALTGYQCSALDLPSFLGLTLSATAKQVINQYFQDMGNGLQTVSI